MAPTMAACRVAAALLMRAAGAAGFEHVRLRAAGHVGIQSGAQEQGVFIPSLAAFFREQNGGDRPEGKVRSSISTVPAQESGAVKGRALENDEPEEKKAEECSKWQCAVCGRCWRLSAAPGGGSTTCAGRVQAVAEQALRFDSPPLASAPARILLEKQEEQNRRCVDPIVRRMLDRARPVVDFMDEEKVVWSLARPQGLRGRGREPGGPVNDS